MWNYQWLREPGELTDEFKDTVYQETQGVVAFIVDMFLVCQLHALSHGKETLTPAIFQYVARTEFEFLQPLLNALRSKQPNRMAKFEDVEVYDIDEIIDRHQMLIPQGASAQGESKSSLGLVARAAAMVRSALGLTDAEARRLVQSVLSADNKSQTRLTQDAIAAWFRFREADEGAKHADPT